MFSWCYFLAGALGAVLMLYGLIEIHYFLRMAMCLVVARFCKKRCHILDTTEVTGICLTTDIDPLLSHMNNVRYMREIDFARLDFYERTNFYSTILQKKGQIFQAASTIRYRRFIRPFSLFKLTSRLIYWDDGSIFMEHRFVSPKDGFVHCIALCRQRILNCSVEEVMKSLLNEKLNLKNGIDKLENGDVIPLKPQMPIEVAKWIEYNEISSANLRTGC